MEMRAKARAEMLPAGGGGAPQPAQMAAINRWALEALSAEELYVRQVRLANDAVDRTGERLPRAYLERFAATLPGKPLLLSHDHAEPPTGLWFAAAVRKAAGGEPGEWSLEAWFYLRKTPANEEIRRQIDAGVIRYASIGFCYDQVTCDLCGSPRAPGAAGGCDHWPGRAYDGQVATFTYGGDPARVEAHEGSLVYLGAQYGAQLTKGVVSGEWWVGNGDSEAQALIADGQAYRAVLQGELARLAGIVNAEAEAELLAAALAGQTAAKWLPVIAGFQARVDALLPPRPVAEPAAPRWHGPASPGARAMRLG